MIHNPIKIFMVLASPTIEISSAASHTHELAKALTSIGIENIIIEPKKEKLSFIEMVKYLKSVKARAIDANTVIHVRSLRLAYLMSFPMLRPKCPLILEANGIWSDEHDNVVTRVMEKRALKKAEAVVCVTKWIAEYFISQGFEKSKFHVVENGVDTEKFKPLSDIKEKVNQRYKIPNHSRMVLFVGQFYAWQGIDSLIKSMKKVHEQIPDARLLIVGFGEQETRLKSLVEKFKLSDTVIFAGKVNHKDVPTIISASDVCVSLKKPMKSGYSPIKIFEYLACEKPVVVSDVNGFEFVNEQKCGIIVPQDNADETADAIIQLLSNGLQAKTMGQNGRYYVIAEHTWQAAAERIISISTKLVE